MADKLPRTPLRWGDLKRSLAGFDRPGLLGLVQDLHALSRDNQAFLHARFGLGQDVLAPYKLLIERAMSPNLATGRPPSIARAKKAIADYKRASGQPGGMAELMVFFCERAAASARKHGLQDDGFFDALVRMFVLALQASVGLPDNQRRCMLNRLGAVRTICDRLGYGVGDDMGRLLSEVRPK